MVGDSKQHASALDELIEWWQDLTQHQINSRAVLLPVPPRWGRTHLLNEFAAFVEADDAPCVVVLVEGKSLGEGLGMQTVKLNELFSKARFEPSVAELAGVDRLGGVTQLGLGVAGLFVTPLAALVGLLLASVGVAAAGRVWDDRPAGKEGVIAKLARAVAALSVFVPVVVIIDDTDWLEPDLAVVLIENLVERINGRVLVVAAVDPGRGLMAALVSRAVYGLTEGRVRTVDVNPGMGYQARIGLAAELCPNLPTAAIRRIGQRTETFAEVFAAASAERLAEIDAHGDDAAIVTVVDEVIDARVDRAPPSTLEVVLAWAGGIMHARQAGRAVAVLGEELPSDDRDVIRFESLFRLADPASPRLAEQVRVLAASQRRSMAEIVLDAAVEIGGDPRAGLLDKVVAWQAAHRVRADLQDRTHLAGVQCQLVHGLEDLDDPTAAYQVAAAALAEYPASGPRQRQTPEQDDLSAAVLRLGRRRQPGRADPLIDATVTAVAAGGAMIGLEARIWAAIDLLGQPGQRERALKLTDQITAELAHWNNLGAVGDRWRLLLAFHAGRAGCPAITQRLLAPMLNASNSPEDEDAARAVLYAVGGPGADTRLQIIGLEAELAALPPDADDDRLRAHYALAADYARLGDYRRALQHGQQELLLRRRIQGADHRDTLITRNDAAFYTSEQGDQAGALQLFQELLPDQVRVLGSDHLDTLITRSNIAAGTGWCGDPAWALQLFRELLPDQERVLGPDHRSTLITRNNVAFWTGQCGDQAGALRLIRELLPDLERVLGSDHPDTLSMRINVAGWTGECGDPGGALRLSQELLPDLERVLGPDHPSTLGTRGTVAGWTEECGDRPGALRLSQELLPDLERVLGPDHPHTLATRHTIERLNGPGLPS